METLELLLTAYKEKFGKLPVGKWAKDEDWLKKKLGLGLGDKDDRVKEEKLEVQRGTHEDSIPQYIKDEFNKLMGETKAQYICDGWLLDTAKNKITKL